jgi:beta-lactamase regulating signal transducer with metallopeptidase domain
MSAALSHAALAVAAAAFDSVWEGALIVVAVSVALRVLANAGAATRYGIWLCALAAIVLTPVLTVAFCDRSFAPIADPAAPIEQSSVSAAPVAPASQFHPIIAPHASAPATAMAIAEPALSVPHKTRITISPVVALAVALIWVLMAIWRGVLLFLDLRVLTVIRRDARALPGAHEFPILLSDRVDVPLAAGFLRPAIILPSALVEQLDAGAVETIVVHEVAHLRRYDVWTNAFARIAQAFIALNPAAWFVMRRLATEREIACDDWVVARTGSGDAFARTLAALATRARLRAPLAAPSAIGARHSVVVRIERLLDARPRRLRLSPPALGGSLMLLALVALALQSVSPVLAYDAQPDLLARASTAGPNAGSCPVPNRGIVMSYLLGPARGTVMSGRDDAELRKARDITKRLGPSNVATFDLTVDAAGKPRKVVVLTPPRYPGMTEDIVRIYMASSYEPALRNCLPVTATIRTAMPFDKPEPRSVSVITPVYPAGWSAEHKAACKVPTVTRARYRPGFAPGTEYTPILPAFPNAMNDLALGSQVKSSVAVHVNAAGAATSVAVVDPSGRPAYDDAVASAARRATYPLTGSACKPLPADYVWQTTFERTNLLFFVGNAARRLTPKRMDLPFFVANPARRPALRRFPKGR